MAQRLRLYDFRISRGPTLSGLCQTNIQQVAAAVNTAQRRLLYASEAGDEGWYGTWAEVAFNMTSALPYITMPREIARLQSLNICQEPIPVQNQFYEYLSFGNGRLPKTVKPCLSSLGVYSRNNAVLWHDIVSTAPQMVRVYYTNSGDVGKRVLLQGLDATSAVIYTSDGTARINGVYLVIASPYVTSDYPLSSVTGIQKDITLGDVQIFLVDPTSGVETLALVMQPGETTAWYRRYYFDELPDGCCSSSSSTTVQITGIAKLDFIPAAVDQDYLLIQNLEALIEETQSVRYSEIDNTSSKGMAQEKHKQAIRLLNGELAHYLGVQQPAIGFSPFGSAKLEDKRIGQML